MDSELENQMIAAFIGDNDIPTRNEQIRYIRRYIDTIPIEDRHSIGKLFYNENQSLIQEHSEGCTFDLMKFSDETIYNSYQLINQILKIPLVAVPVF